jgi:hypothetical protein
MAESLKKIARDGANKAFDQFQELARKIVAVPKSEADAKEAVYKQIKAQRRKKS